MLCRNPYNRRDEFPFDLRFLPDSHLDRVQYGPAADRRTGHPVGLCGLFLDDLASKLIITLIVISCTTEKKGFYSDLSLATRETHSVTHLKLNTCQSIEEGDIDKTGTMYNLESLEISECSKIRHLPNSIKNLKKLKKIVFNWNGTRQTDWKDEFIKREREEPGWN